METTDLKALLSERREMLSTGEIDPAACTQIAEAYAREKLDMDSTPGVVLGYDGLINGRRVCLRTLDRSTTPASHAQFSIRKGLLAKADDLLVVVLDDCVTFHIGPVPIDQITYTVTPLERRYALARIQEAAA